MSFLFCFSWGFTYFDVVDRYISVYLMFILGIGQCFSAAWMFGREELMENEDRSAVAVLSIIYWMNLLIMGPVTVFVFDEDEGRGSKLFGVLIFWTITCIAIALSFALKKDKNIVNWYQKVFLYGAYQLAEEVVKRSDETLQGDKQWWSGIFIFWWAFSIKYFMPWCLWALMMWNFKLDITPNPKTGMYYESYHIFWQLMGFVYPFIGLLCFFIPICCTPEREERRCLNEFAEESDPQYEKEEKAFRDRLIATRKIQREL
jgi:hypothetical protein